METTKHQLINIPLTDIVIGKTNPRSVFDETDITELTNCAGFSFLNLLKLSK